MKFQVHPWFWLCGSPWARASKPISWSELCGSVAGLSFLTDTRLHKGTYVLFVLKKLICADINRILLVPRTDDSLTAWCVEEGSLQTSRREPCWAVEGNEACPAVIVLIALGFPRGRTSPSWDLSLAKNELTHILFLLVLLLVCYCSNCDVACKQTAAIILFAAIEWWLRRIQENRHLKLVTFFPPPIHFWCCDASAMVSPGLISGSD